MNIILVILALAALGLIGIVTKSLFVIIWGVAGIAISFLVLCTGALLGLLGKLIVIILSLAVIGAAIIFFPLALFAIIPGIYFAYRFAKNRGYYQPRAILKRG